MENYNGYVGKLAEKQMEANMQSHLKDYGKKEYPKEQVDLLDRLPADTKLSLYTFFTNTLRKLYQRETIDSDYQVDEQEIARAMKYINEECLDDKDFSKVLTGESKEFSKDIETYTIRDNNDHFVHVTISYLPSIDADTPNIIRLHILEIPSLNNNRTCNIDFKSDGNVDITKMENQEFYFKQDVLQDIEDYLMNIYELADLSTNKMHK